MVKIGRSLLMTVNLRFEAPIRRVASTPICLPLAPLDQEQKPGGASRQPRSRGKLEPGRLATLAQAWTSAAYVDYRNWEVTGGVESLRPSLSGGRPSKPRSGGAFFSPNVLELSTGCERLSRRFRGGDSCNNPTSKQGRRLPAIGAGHRVSCQQSAPARNVPGLG
jgi:hypothetical protein